jgi:hypothetical protein
VSIVNFSTHISSFASLNALHFRLRSLFLPHFRLHLVDAHFIICIAGFVSLPDKHQLLYTNKMTLDISPKKFSMDSTVSDDKMEPSLMKKMFDLMFNKIATIKTEHRQEIVALTRHMKANKQEIAANKTEHKQEIAEHKQEIAEHKQEIAEHKQEIAEHKQEITITQKMEAMDTKLTSTDTKLRLILLNTTIGESVDKLDEDDV